MTNLAPITFSPRVAPTQRERSVLNLGSSFCRAPVQTRPPTHTLGFSLVEVVLALGIVAISVVAVLGLMPVGLNAFQEANRSNIEAEIVAQIARNLEASSFTRLQTEFATPQTYYYDSEGRELFESGGAPPADWMYRTEVSLNETQVQGENIRALGRTDPALQPLLRSAVIALTFKREPSKVRRYPVHLVDRGVR